MTHQITAIRYFGLKIQFWPAVLISMLALKIVLSVALKQGEWQRRMAASATSCSSFWRRHSPQSML